MDLEAGVRSDWDDQLPRVRDGFARGCVAPCVRRQELEALRYACLSGLAKSRHPLAAAVTRLNRIAGVRALGLQGPADSVTRSADACCVRAAIRLRVPLPSGVADLRCVRAVGCALLLPGRAHIAYARVAANGARARLPLAADAGLQAAARALRLTGAANSHTRPGSACFIRTARRRVNALAARRAGQDAVFRAGARSRGTGDRIETVHKVPEERHDAPVLVVAVVLAVGHAEDDGVVCRAAVELDAFRLSWRSHPCRNLVGCRQSGMHVVTAQPF